MADNYIDVPQDINTENPVFIDKDTMKPKRLVKIYEISQEYVDYSKNDDSAVSVPRVAV